MNHLEEEHLLAKRLLINVLDFANVSKRNQSEDVCTARATSPIDVRCTTAFQLLDDNYDDSRGRCNICKVERVVCEKPCGDDSKCNDALSISVFCSSRW